MGQTVLKSSFLHRCLNTLWRDDDVINPCRVRAGIDASIFDVFPGQCLGISRYGKGLLPVVHRSRPAVIVSGIPRATRVVNAKEEVIKTALRGYAVAEGTGGGWNLGNIQRHARLLIVTDGSRFGELGAAESRVSADGPI